MSDHHANLLAVLKEQSAVVNLLIELGLSEVETLKQDDVPGLISITERQRGAVDRAHRLEQSKAALLRDIESQRAADKISQCQVATGLKNEIEEESRHLAELVKRLREINGTNRVLVNMSLSFVKAIQRALGMATGSYDARGMLSGPPASRGKLDASV